MRRKITVGAIAGGIMLAGALTASPASADAVQNGCLGTSFKLYSSNVGYCFNGIGYSAPFAIWGLSIQSDSYAGDLQIQDRWSGNWFWWGFGYRQTSYIDNNPSGLRWTMSCDFRRRRRRSQCRAGLLPSSPRPHRRQ